MTTREQIGWHVPSDEWGSFTRFIDEKYGQSKRKVRREVENAMREWVDDDVYAEIESLVDRLVSAAGRTPEELSGSKSQGISVSSDAQTKKVQCRIDAELKAEFKRMVKEQTDKRPGMVLARALRVRREGGRAERVQKKLERIVDDAENLLAEVPREGKLSIVEQRTIAICDQLGHKFEREELAEVIESVAGGSNPTQRKYENRVFDRLDLCRHPCTPDFYVHEDRAEEICQNADLPDPDAPAIDHLVDGEYEYGDLSFDEKVLGVRIIVARRALSNNNRACLWIPEIVAILDQQPGLSHTKKLINKAADTNGFSSDKKDGTRRLLVDFDRITDDEVLSAVDNGQTVSSGVSDEGSAD